LEVDTFYGSLHVFAYLCSIVERENFMGEMALSADRTGLSKSRKAAE